MSDNRPAVTWSDLSAILGDISPTVLIAKLVGAMAGSLISIVYILPRGRREAFARLCVGLVTGLIFGGVTGVKLADFLGLLDKVSTVEVALAGAAFASLSAWWGLGVFNKVAHRYSNFSKLDASYLKTEKFNHEKKDGES